MQEKASSDHPVHVTAARGRMLPNLKGYVWAAARGGGRLFTRPMRQP